MDTITTLVEFSEFQSGWWAGLLALAVVVGSGWSTRSRRRGRTPPWGLMGPAWVVGSLLALDGWFGAAIVPIPSQLVIGLAALAGAAELTSRTPNPKVLGPVLAIPGAILVTTTTDFHGPGWVVPLVFVTIAFGGPLAADLDLTAARLGFGPVLWMVTVVGVYLTVPDTEIIRPLVGVALPLGLTGIPLRAARLGAGGAAAGVGLLMWVAAIEGYGRPGSIVGAVGALGFFVLEPLARGLGRRHQDFVPWARRLRPWGMAAAFIGAHTVVVLFMTRVAGFAENGGPAGALAVPGALVGLVVAWRFGLSARTRPTRTLFGPVPTPASGRRRRRRSSSRTVGSDATVGPGDSVAGREEAGAPERRGEDHEGRGGDRQGGGG